MNSRAKSKSENSICEKSMKVVANIIRLSSISVACKTLGTTPGKAAKDPPLSGSDNGDMVPEKEPLDSDQVYGSRRSKKPQNRANPTYVTDPVLSNGSNSPVVHEDRVHAKQKKEESIDELASEYIRKIRKQLLCGL